MHSEYSATHVRQQSSQDARCRRCGRYISTMQCHHDADGTSAWCSEHEGAKRVEKEGKRMRKRRESSSKKLAANESLQRDAQDNGRAHRACPAQRSAQDAVLGSTHPRCSNRSRAKLSNRFGRSLLLLSSRLAVVDPRATSCCLQRC